jgi:integrase/recombinase XerD
MSGKIRLGKTKDSRTRKKLNVQENSEQITLLQEQLKEQSDFVAYLFIKGYSSATVERYTKEVKRFIRWAEEGNMQVETISYADVLHHIQSKREQVSQRTISALINSLKHYYNHLQEIGAVAENPTTQIQIKGVKRRILYHILSKQELESLYENYEVKEEEEQEQKNKNQNWYRASYLTRKRNKIILGLIIYQGLSSRELGKLLEKDIQLRAGKIYIAGGRKSNEREMKLEAHQVLDVMEYTLKIRPELIALNKSNASEKLFVNSQGGRSFNNVIQQLMKQLKEQNSKIKNAKQIRASVITHWLKQHNLRQVQYMAGHRYVSSTEAYRINDLDDLQEDISKYHPIG